MADDKKQKQSEDDKSINDLLKEYAEDVKDKDLDDFLKESDDEDEDASFEADEDSAEEQSEKVLAEQGQPRRKGSGLLTMVFIVVAFGAAGAGAYMYLNRDSGMTAIMGGFNGAEDDDAPTLAPPAVVDNSAPLGDPAAEQTGMPTMPSAPDQPLPIMNEGATLEPAPAPEAATGDTPAPGADVLAVPDAKQAPVPAAPDAANAMLAPAATETVQTLAPISESPAPAETATPATTTPTPAAAATPATAPASDTANAVDAWASGTVTPAMPGPDAVGNTTPVLPEKQVEEVKAKPPVTKKAAKAETPKSETASSEPLDIKAPKPATISSSSDGALPPPYVAIQAKKASGGASVNRNVADVTKATGGTAAMIAQGGGMVAVGGANAPVADTSQYAAPVPAAEPALRNIPLAINGGRSLPAGVVETRAYAQLPDTTQGTKPAATASAPVIAPVAPAVTPQAPLPAAPAPAAVSSGNDARALVGQAMAAEKSGDASAALNLYQKALEADAVYGDGKSIDRGMVYDRIGALRTAQ